jgi:UDP-glucose 4-epimerase
VNYIITGGAGFIGSHLARYLVGSGHSVGIIDNLSTGNLSNISDIQDKVSFYKLDILDDSIEDVIKNNDGIFHYAALVSVPESFVKPKEYENVNVLGTKNIFCLAKKFHIKTVFASSSSVYGNTKNIPTPESGPLDPVNPYGITKLKVEHLAKEYSKYFDIVGLRYYNVYGSTMVSSGAGVISQFYQSIQNHIPLTIDGNGEQLRDFVYIQDVVKATVSAMEKSTGSSFINVGSGNTISILDLANLFIKYSGSNLQPIFQGQKEGNVLASQADVSLAKKLLDWQPQTTLEDWIKNLYKS